MNDVHRVSAKERMTTRRASIHGSWLDALAIACGMTLGLLGVAGPSLAATTVTTTSFDYDTTTGLLKKSIVEPGDPNLCVVSEHTLDAYGRPQVVTTRNCNGSAAVATGSPNEASAPAGMAAFASRVTRHTYSADQRFIASTINTRKTRPTTRASAPSPR
jgi:hypothetical protein